MQSKEISLIEKRDMVNRLREMGYRDIVDCLMTENYYLNKKINIRKLAKQIKISREHLEFLIEGMGQVVRRRYE